MNFAIIKSQGVCIELHNFLGKTYMYASIKAIELLHNFNPCPYSTSNNNKKQETVVQL